MTPPASLRRAAPWAALALLLVLGPAQGHIAGSMGYATVSLYGGTVRYSLTLGPDALAAAGGEAAPADGRRLVEATTRWPIWSRAKSPFPRTG